MNISEKIRYKRNPRRMPQKLNLALDKEIVLYTRHLYKWKDKNLAEKISN